MQKPTDRELEILQILWKRGEATVRQVYEELRTHTDPVDESPIVQNTVQASLRTMEQRQLVGHRVAGRTFVYRPLVKQQRTRMAVASNMLSKVFDGAIDQMVRSAFDAKKPTDAELDHLQLLIEEARRKNEGR